MTLREKAEYYDEWEPYFESLARIRREVVKSIPEWDDYCFDDDEVIHQMIENDAEVRPEIERLIMVMIEEVRDEERR